ncbi:MAG: hypothetical protein IIA45_09880 [Bacteroidetes bacterium]|nr:hypothetical protein [Bacteroidota bacterium]
MKYLILYQNTLQDSFLFQFLPTQQDSQFLNYIESDKPINRQTVETKADKFIAEYSNFLRKNAKDYKLLEDLPDGFVILSIAKFEDHYYYTGDNNWTMVALGDWKRHMAPPSIVEFFMSLLIGSAIDIACRDKFPKSHHATRGCISDFAASISDVRLSVLTGFLCDSCSDTIKHARSEKLVTDAKDLLAKKWLGNVSEPSHVAETAKKLGYDLFRTKGVKQTFTESLLATVEQEGVKLILKIIGTVIVAALLLWLGLK